MSPSANTSGWPLIVRSGSTVTRPARSSSAPLCAASLAAIEEAVTPAAQMTVRVGIRVGLHLGRLERAEDVTARHQRALQRLHLGGVLTPLVVAEVGVARAAGHDQGVVADPRRGGHPVGRRQDQLAALQLEVTD